MRLELRTQARRNGQGQRWRVSLGRMRHLDIRWAWGLGWENRLRGLGRGKRNRDGWTVYIDVHHFHVKVVYHREVPQRATA